MANITLTNLPTVTALNGTEPLLGVQNSSSVQITTGQIAGLSKGSSTLPFPVSIGGTGDTTLTQYGLMYGNGTAPVGVVSPPSGTNYVLVGSSGSAPTWQPTIPVTAGVDSISFGTTGLTPSTAQAGVITVAGTLVVANGGTGQSSYTIGDLLYASSSTALSKLADVATGSVLISGGVGAAPSYSSSPTLTTSLTTPLVLGGTNAASTLTLQSTSGVGTTDSVVIKTGNAGAVTALTATTTGQVTVPFFATNSFTSTTPVLSFNASNSPIASGATVSGSYLQFIMQNKSATAGASTNYVLSNDSGTDSTYYGEFGMNSSIFSASTPADFFSINNSVYFSSHDGDVAVGSGNGFKTYFAWGATATNAHVINSSGALGFSTNLGTTPALSGTTGFGSSGQTLITGGSVAAPAWGTLGISGGGTGQTAALTQYGVVYGASTTAMGITAAGTTGQVLVATTGAAPSWGSITSVTSITFGTTGLTPSTATTGAVTVAGTLVAANGGTGQSSYAVGDLLYASTTTALSRLADVAIGSILVSGGVSTAPAWSASPTITTSITTPLHIGGTTASSTLTLQSTSGVGTTDSILFKVGNNGAVTGMTISTTGAVTTASTISDSIGNVRTIVQNTQSTAYTLVATDNGKYISISTGGVTVPASIFTAGQNIVIYNNSSSVQTITQGASVTMTLAGSTTTGARSLAANGVATVLCTGTNTFVITGQGLT
jgi:hypothetical protein